MPTITTADQYAAAPAHDDLCEAYLRLEGHVVALADALGDKADERLAGLARSIRAGRHAWCYANPLALTMGRVHPAPADALAPEVAAAARVVLDAVPYAQPMPKTFRAPKLSLWRRFVLRLI